MSATFHLAMAIGHAVKLSEVLQRHHHNIIQKQAKKACHTYRVSCDDDNRDLFCCSTAHSCACSSFRRFGQSSGTAELKLHELSVLFKKIRNLQSHFFFAAKAKYVLQSCSNQRDLFFFLLYLSKHRKHEMKSEKYATKRTEISFSCFRETYVYF